jgi:hypothetical protein
MYELSCVASCQSCTDIHWVMHAHLLALLGGTDAWPLCLTPFCDVLCCGFWANLFALHCILERCVCCCCELGWPVRREVCGSLVHCTWQAKLLYRLLSAGLCTCECWNLLVTAMWVSMITSSIALVGP